ncbi:hypothetical protein C8J57DRAFT_1513249 [Mycena rebaudengoi]|nr:hypothetical protein C8J57DRAFT_1513249 [Mycena rebaudengoi]
MKLAVFAAALVSGAAAQLMINTPTIGASPGAAECQPLLISWSGGNSPFFVVSPAIHRSTDPWFSHRFFQTVQHSPPTGIPVANFGQQDGFVVTWPAVNQTLGTNLILQVRDQTGLTASSAPFPVTAGSDNCLHGGGGVY